MKKIHITESQEKKLIKEAMGFGFSFGYLKSLTSLKKKYKYCKEFLGFPIGKGTSRICFQLNDEMILKLAINNKGKAQNEHEGQYDYYKDTYSIFPKVYREYSDMDNFTFIVSEFVLPAKKEDFAEVYGFPFSTFQAFIWTCGANTGKLNRGFEKIKDSEFSEMIDNDPTETLNEFYDYIGCYDCGVGDMTVLQNLGLVNRNGNMQIVLLDEGLSEEIYNKFYKPKRVLPW